MRAVWKGYLKCSLVAIPVQMYGAVVDRSIRFVLLHRDCGGRVRMERVCARCGKRLEPDELVRAYPYGKDRYVVVTDQELEEARQESSSTIEIVRFVPREEVNPIYRDVPHWVVPEGPVGAEAFALFCRAMRETQRCGLARMVWRHRERWMLLEPRDGCLLAFGLHHASEVQDLRTIEPSQAAQQVAVDERALQMAKALIEGLSGEFDPERCRDGYTERLMALIEAKARGEQLRLEPREEASKVISLMDALQQSLQELGRARLEEIPKKEMAPAGGGQRPAARRGRARKQRS